MELEKRDLTKFQSNNSIIVIYAKKKIRKKNHSALSIKVIDSSMKSGVI